jgi:hypothetical protein
MLIEEFHNLYSSTNKLLFSDQIKGETPNGLRVASVGQIINICAILPENLKERENWRDLRVHRMTLLKRDLGKYCRSVYTEFIWLTVGSSCGLFSTLQ